MTQQGRGGVTASWSGVVLLHNTAINIVRLGVRSSKTNQLINTCGLISSSFAASPGLTEVKKKTTNNNNRTNSGGIVEPCGDGRMENSSKLADVSQVF